MSRATLFLSIRLLRVRHVITWLKKTTPNSFHLMHKRHGNTLLFLKGQLDKVVVSDDYLLTDPIQVLVHCLGSFGFFVIYDLQLAVKLSLKSQILLFW